jgi:hypothetical protein
MMDDKTIDDLNAELREQDFLDLDGELADVIEAMMLAEDAAFMAGALEPIDMSGWTMTTTQIVSPYFVEPVEAKMDLPEVDVPGAVRYVNEENASYMFKDGKWIVFSMTATKPDRAPPRMLTGTCDGVHPPRSMDYFRRFADAPTNAEELKMWASIGVSGSVLREWAGVYPIEDQVVFKVPKSLRDRSEYCTDVPHKHSAGPNPCNEVQLMAPQPCTLIGPDPLPKKRKILVSR